MYTKINSLQDYIKECRNKISSSRSSFSLSKEARSDYVWWYQEAIKSAEKRIKELSINPLV